MKSCIFSLDFSRKFNPDSNVGVSRHHYSVPDLLDLHLIVQFEVHEGLPDVGLQALQHG